MTNKEEDNLWLFGILGALGSAALYFLTQMGPPKISQGVNSYQSQSSYTPPPPPKSSGCGCNGATRNM